MNIPAVLLLTGTVTGLLASESAYCQIPDVQRGIDRLLYDLDKRSKSEGKTPEIKFPPNSTTPWRSLKVGMTAGEVESLLGKPNRVQTEGDVMKWIWEDGKPRGWVSFGSKTSTAIQWRYQ